jgi:hypothetical protein
VLRILPRGTSRWRSQQIALHPQEAAVDGACMQLSRLFRNTRIAPHLAALEHMEPSNAGTADMAAMIGPPVIFDRVYCCALRDHMQSLERLRLPLNPFLEGYSRNTSMSVPLVRLYAIQLHDLESAAPVKWSSGPLHCADFVFLLSSKVGCFWSRFHGPQSSFPEPTSHSLAVDLCTSCSGALRSFRVPRTALGVHR